MSEKYKPSYSNEYAKELSESISAGVTDSTGKKVLEWKYKISGKRDLVIVAIKAYSKNGDIWFQAHSDFLLRDFRDTDISRLKTAIDMEMEWQSHAIANIDWSDWLEVVVSGDDSEFSDSRWSSLGADVKINVREMKRGVHPVTGATVTILSNGAVVEFPAARHIDEIEEPLEFRVRNGTEVSYVPATQENLVAIRSLLNKIKELRLSVADLLSQAKIENSLIEEPKLSAIPSL